MESTSTNITIRIDKETKRNFENFCDNVGINLTTAFNMFVKATLRTRELPFAVTDIDTRKKEARKLFLKNVEDMQQQSIINGTSDMTMDEIDDIIAEVRKDKRGEI
ncbi:MAG: type II toxin-antitoxin system RelB/DinJ family antitoxin [Oscillospiraceae bacterium]|nr:type II toxin-antitoxin system RelB/DinJ family antitoxin [Oscillospiraceae bacterium]